MQSILALRRICAKEGIFLSLLSARDAKNPVLNLQKWPDSKNLANQFTQDRKTAWDGSPIGQGVRFIIVCCSLTSYVDLMLILEAECCILSMY